MLNAMSQGRSGSMCTIHADSSLGIFRRLASYAVQAPERLPLESTNLLIAGAVHFSVFIEALNAAPGADMRHVTGRGVDQLDRHAYPSVMCFEAVRRRRFVSSVHEVVGAEGLHVISNEIFRADRTGRVHPGAPLRSSTLDELVEHGFDPRPRTEGPR